MGTKIMGPKMFLATIPETKKKTLEDDLGRLTRNIRQMTPEQKKQYARALYALKKKVFDGARDLVLEYVLDGYYFFENDKSERQSFITTCRNIIDQASDNGVFANLAKTLAHTCSLPAMLEAATQLRDQIYEAYRPYWESRCVWRPDTGKWYNQIIRAEWDEVSGLWKDQYRQEKPGYPAPPEK